MKKANSQWHHPRWQHQCSLKHFPWLCVAQMESPSHGKKSGLPAQLLAKACASSNFSLFGHFCAPEAAMATSPGSFRGVVEGETQRQTKLTYVRGGGRKITQLQHDRDDFSRGLCVLAAPRRPWKLSAGVEVQQEVGKYGRASRRPLSPVSRYRVGGHPAAATVSLEKIQ